MRLSIRLKLVLAVVAPLAVVAAVFVPLNFRALRGQALAHMERYVAKVVDLQAARFDGQFSAAAAAARATADLLASGGPLDEKRLFAVLRANVESDPLIFGSCIAVEPGTYPGKAGRFAPYVCREGGGLKASDIAPGYDYTDPRWDWYRIPKETGRAHWTEPFFDEGGGNILMCTHAVPFFGADGKFQGVATVDIPLGRLQATAGSLGLGPEEGFIIVSRKGVVISSPRAEEIMKLDVSRGAAAQGNPVLVRATASMLAGGTGLFMIEDFPEPGAEAKFLAFTPIPSTGWSLVAGVPVSEVMAPVYAEITQRAGVAVGAIGLVIVCLLVISGWVTRPIERLARAARGMSASGLGETGGLGPPTNDELGDLSSAFSAMSARLKEQVTELTKATAQREAVESELRVAREIQLALMPSVPRFAQAQARIEAWARSVPARQVGGDFFDLIPLGDGSAVFVIADVSGKGVPAAIYMAVARTMLRLQAVAGRGPGEMLTRASTLLLEHNERAMFLTATVAHFEPSTGRVRYANGAHPPAILLTPGAAPRRALEPTGTLIGAIEGQRFDEGEFVLEAGSRLLLFTDGAPEARRADGEFFGDERVIAAAARSNGSGAQALCDGLVGEVERFQEGRLADDVTVLAFGARPGASGSGPRVPGSG